MGAGERRAVAHEERAEAVRQEEALVRVEGDRVALLDPAQERLAARGQPEEAAVGGVGVDPEAVLAGDRQDLRQRVDGAGVRRADVGDDEERPPAPRAVLADGLLERRRARAGSRASVGSARRLARGKPARRAAFATQWCVSSEK